MKHLIIIIISILLLCGCEKIQTLPRKNPLDIRQISGGVKLEFSKYVYNGSVNASLPKDGMYVYVVIYVRNIGVNTAEEVKATFKYLNNDSEVDYINQIADYGAIPPNSEIAGKVDDGWHSLKLRVSPSVISGSKKDFSINLSDSNNNNWCDTVSFTIQ